MIRVYINTDSVRVFEYVFIYRLSLYTDMDRYKGYFIFIGSGMTSVSIGTAEHLHWYWHD